MRYTVYHDSFLLTPLSLPVPPTTVDQAQMMRAFIISHPNIFDFPAHEEILFNDVNYVAVFLFSFS